MIRTAIRNNLEVFILYILWVVTVWLCGVRVFEAFHFHACTEPIRLFIFSYFTPIVEDELAVLQRRTAVELPAEPRITYSFC
jgi:hypothetical protein